MEENIYQPMTMAEYENYLTELNARQQDELQRNYAFYDAARKTLLDRYNADNPAEGDTGGESGFQVNMQFIDTNTGKEVEPVGPAPEFNEE